MPRRFRAPVSSVSMEPAVKTTPRSGRLSNNSSPHSYSDRISIRMPGVLFLFTIRRRLAKSYRRSPAAQTILTRLPPSPPPPPPPLPPPPPHPQHHHNTPPL